MSKAKVKSDIKVDLPPVPQPGRAPRSLEEITRDFSVKCTKAGHLQYEIQTKQEELDSLNRILRDLNLEASAVAAQTGGQNE